VLLAQASGRKVPTSDASDAGSGGDAHVLGTGFGISASKFEDDSGAVCRLSPRYKGDLSGGEYGEGELGKVEGGVGLGAWEVEEKDPGINAANSAARVEQALRQVFQWAALPLCPIYIRKPPGNYSPSVSPLFSSSFSCLAQRLPRA
jgi:hypothetical protein